MPTSVNVSLQLLPDPNLPRRPRQEYSHPHQSITTTTTTTGKGLDDMYEIEDYEDNISKHRKILWLFTLIIFLGYLFCAGYAYNGAKTTDGEIRNTTQRHRSTGVCRLPHLQEAVRHHAGRIQSRASPLVAVKAVGGPSTI